MVLFPPEEFVKMKSHLVRYRCALRNLEMRLEVLNDDFNHLQRNNPIEHIKSRLKSYESIAQKLQRLGHPITADAAMDNLTDIAGLRCICSYAKDIFYLAEVFKCQPDLEVISEKNYVTTPKPSGYRSYHIIFKVPVFLTDSIDLLPVELQIRTQAMDFWGSLEHKIRYKYRSGMPIHLVEGLKVCAEQIADLDERMFKIQELIDIAY